MSQQSEEFRLSPETPRHDVAEIKCDIQRVRAINEAKFRKTGKWPLMKCVTFGCQMNAHDSEKLKGVLLEAGYETAESERDADLVIYNTCCVRQNAENKVWGNLGILKGLKSRKPDMTIVLCGCMMQREPVIERVMKTYRHVDIIFGTYNIHTFARLLEQHLTTGQTIIDVWRKPDETEENGPNENLPVSLEHPFKAGVNIMYGCDNFCSYCIVPHVRGRERSRPSSDIVAEVRRLAGQGVVEVMLLGQNVNSYGRGLTEKIDFSGLLRKVSAVSGIKRIRFMTSHPKDLSDDLIQAMADLPNVCGHLHLPVQSGSDRVLAAMNRKYTKAHYLELIAKTRAAMPDIAITTDVIVGFPGETEEDFQETLDMVRKTHVSGAYTFIYSVRTGTPAADMPGQVPADVASERFGRLLSVLNPLIDEENNKLVGRTADVLVEAVTEKDDRIVTGRLENDSLVHFPGNEQLIGTIVPVKLTECKTFYYIGIQDQA